MQMGVNTNPDKLPVLKITCIFQDFLLKLTVCRSTVFMKFDAFGPSNNNGCLNPFPKILSEAECFLKTPSREEMGKEKCAFNFIKNFSNARFSRVTACVSSARGARAYRVIQTVLPPCQIITFLHETKQAKKQLA